MKKIILYVIIAAVIAGGLGFYIGLQYSAGSATTSGRGTSTSTYAGRSGANGRTVSGGLVTGSIVSTSGQSITVQLANGNSQVIFLATTTPIMKTATGTIKDFSVGQDVVVTGTTNSDGSVTAQSVQIRPAGSGTFGSSPSQTPPSPSQ